MYNNVVTIVHVIPSHFPCNYPFRIRKTQLSGNVDEIEQNKVQRKKILLAAHALTSSLNFGLCPKRTEKKIACCVMNYWMHY